MEGLDQSGEQWNGLLLPLTLLGVALLIQSGTGDTLSLAGCFTGVAFTLQLAAPLAAAALTGDELSGGAVAASPTMSLSSPSSLASSLRRALAPAAVALAASASLRALINGRSSSSEDMAGESSEVFPFPFQRRKRKKNESGNQNRQRNGKKNAKKINGRRR